MRNLQSSFELETNVRSAGVVIEGPKVFYLPEGWIGEFSD